MQEKHIEEVAQKNKAELEEKKSTKHANLHMVNEIDRLHNKHATSSGTASYSQVGEHRKQRKHRHRRQNPASATTRDNDSCSSGSSHGSRHNSAHHATKDLRVKRPSIRQKLFRQNVPTSSTIATTLANVNIVGALGQSAALPVLPMQQQQQAKKKRAERMLRKTSMP